MTLRQISSEVERAPLRQLPYRDPVVYGPIQSRRIGWSLGINLCPATHKVCSYDCVYCQFPRAGRNWQAELPKLDRAPELLYDIEQKILERIQNKVYFDSITVSGNGDPSVHPDLYAVARSLRVLVTKLNHPVTLSILTNAVPIGDARFIEALSFFDRKIIKLDAGDEDVLQRVNRPHTPVCLDSLAEALSSIHGVVIQTMVLTGIVDNRPSILSTRYSELVNRTRAKEVQLYTVNKKTAYDGVFPVSERDLRELADRLKSSINSADVLTYYQGTPSGFPDVRPPSTSRSWIKASAFK